MYVQINFRLEISQFTNHQDSYINDVFNTGITSNKLQSRH